MSETPDQAAAQALRNQLTTGHSAFDRESFGRPQCPECSRVFDLTDPIDADEWAYGHDCEV